jgi:hypothetical protein
METPGDQDAVRRSKLLPRRVINVVKHTYGCIAYHVGDDDDDDHDVLEDNYGT